ncbi:hypothetical protein [Sphingobacterium alkalisoli]|uniref:hypothetical protein n=1 Tax=Sphingobacterium alkalisoli TaxID=1874115 RepID=UPI00145F3D9E|nr:hypothetical protein [Sphingobacterium alkalisoli]
MTAPTDALRAEEVMLSGSFTSRDKPNNRGDAMIKKNTALLIANCDCLSILFA